jgi:hypothetical protein
VDAVQQAFRELHFEFAEQFLVALLPIALTVAMHGKTMHWVGRYYRRYSNHAAEGSPALARSFVAIVIVLMMLGAHFAEIFGWAVFYWSTGLIHDVQSAVDFSISAYTTLGSSSVRLAPRWEGVDGLEAMTAMLMFGWSTAILAIVMKPKFI